MSPCSHRHANEDDDETCKCYFAFQFLKLVFLLVLLFFVNRHITLLLTENRRLNHQVSNLDSSSGEIKGIFLSDSLSYLKAYWDEKTLEFKSCPRFWNEYKSRCFRTFNTKANWTSANGRCHGAGGHLASIKDNAQSDHVFITDLVRAYGKKHSLDTAVVWIGVNDMVSENMFMNVNTRVMSTYRFWEGYPEEENITNTRDCVAVVPQEKGYKSWMDKECQEMHNYICETKSLF